jgi:hypothetical protein
VSKLQGENSKLLEEIQEWLRTHPCQRFRDRILSALQDTFKVTGTVLMQLFDPEGLN